MAKPKVPKGTLNIGCISQLPADLVDEFVDQFGTATRGSTDALQWGDTAIADLEYYRYKKDLQIIANANLTRNIKQHPKDAKWGARAALVPDYFEGKTGQQNVETRAHAIKGKLGSILNEWLDKHRPGYLGFQRDKKGQVDIIRELKGEKTGNQVAAEAADRWLVMTEYVRNQLNNAGARIPKLDDWSFPQYHDSGLVANVTPDEWLDFLTDKLDWIRMGSEANLDVGTLRKMLKEEVYQNIATDGAHKIDLNRVSGKPQGRGLITSLRQHRFMHFKDADGWIAYQEKFGSSDYVATMDNWMERMSTNLAAMEVLGPDPHIGLQQIFNTLRKEGRADAIDGVQLVYDNVMGEIGVTNHTAAAVGSGIRQLNIPIHLGNAFLSMATDPVFTAMTAAYNDVPIFKTLMRTIKIAAKNAANNSEDLKFLSQIGITAEYAADRLLAASRYTDVQPHKWASRLSEMSIRASWMHNFTMAARAAFAMEYAAVLAKDIGKSWGQLSSRRIDAFERAGIGPPMWDQIRSRGVATYKGVDFIDINKIGAQTGKESARRVSSLIHTEMAYAVPTPGAATRAWQNQGAPRGSFRGEGTRFGMEFKSFPIVMVMLHLRRAMNGQAMSRAAYTSGLMLGLFMLGQVSTGLKDMSRGRDPVGLTDDDGSANWIQIFRALTQGGGLGIYGDFLFMDHNRFGQDFASTLAGPTIGAASDLAGVGQAGLIALWTKVVDGNASEEEMEKFKELFGRNAKMYMPELWYTRGLQERAMNKTINAMTDGEWDRKLRNAEKRRYRDTGQENFWAEDEWAPNRAPRVNPGQSD